MMMRRTSLASLFVVLWLGSSSIVLAQFNTATLSGRITDPQGKVVPKAEVQLVNIDTNVGTTTQTNGDGIYVLPAIQPGRYRLTVRKDGFHEILKPEFTLHTQDDLEQNFSLEVGSVAETVTVSAGISEAETTNPAVSMTVTREFVEDMPLNGRSFQDLIQLAPGTVASTGYTGRPGYYSIDGQHTDSNNFTVDGVSANLGGYNNSGEQGSPGNGLAGAVPVQTALGTTQSLVSVDALQEFKIQTSGYTAEYGRNPGGQVAFTTRSGTNDMHGTLFDYFRNTALDANSSFNDYNGIPKTAEHQNDFGGTVGGPIRIPHVYDGKDKTFFFVSYEGLRLLLPADESEYVPTQAFRQWAAPSVQPFLNIAPLPKPNTPGNQDGCTIPDPTTGQPTACDALFSNAYSYPSNLDSFSARIDQSFGTRFHAFVRYADTPSSIGAGPIEVVQNVAINVHSWTAGLTTTISSSLLDDLRFNYSHDGEESVSGLSSFDGSVPFARSLLIPAAYEGPYASAVATVRVGGTSLFSSGRYSGTGTVQHQYQIVDSLTWTRGSHSLKFGVDWRKLTPKWIQTPYLSGIQITNLADIQEGYATTFITEATATGAPVFYNVSLYAQDHWRITQRLSIDYGLRWDINPPPGPSNGRFPVTLTSTDLSTATLAPIGTAPYKTDYHALAPRVGFAWNAIPSQNHALTVRGGFGLFFDTAQQLIGSAYASAYPFRVVSPTQVHVSLPFTDAELAPPSLNFPLIPPYPNLSEISSRDLSSPYTEQWNVSLDQALNSRNTLTLSYVGNIGRKLLFTEGYGAYGPILENPLFTFLNFTNNAGESNYNALQVQDTGRVANGLDVVGSFTWAHARDNVSSEFSQSGAPIWGNSDYDLRRVLNLALNYQVPSLGSHGWIRSLTRGWTLANRFSTQSGYPLYVTQTTVSLPDGSSVNYWPDLVPGVPIYLHGSASDLNGQPVPGHWRLNSAAFAAVPTDPTTGNPIRQGTLGRNFLRSPGFWALNTAVQRSFPIYEELHLIFRVDAFNILNHPNYNGIDTGLYDSTFGTSNGFGGTVGSSNSLYAMGAARSLQLSLKLQF